jgi:hypothetical protein
MKEELKRNPRFWDPQDKCEAIFDEKTRNALNQAKIITIDPSIIALHDKSEHQPNTDVADIEKRAENGEKLKNSRR